MPNRTMSFVLNCTPTPQQRARHAVRGKFASAYKSSAQKANERTLEALLLPHTPKTPTIGPVAVEITASFPVPISAPKKAKEGMLEGKICHTKKPDVDNLAKQMLDAMTRLQFWQDDRQVVSVTCTKRYAATGSWAVNIREVREGEQL